MASFSNYTAPQLRECAKHFGIKKCSKMKKVELAQFLNKKLKVMKNGEVRPRGKRPPKQMKGGEIEDDEFDVGEIDNFYDEIPLPIPGDKRMTGIVNKFNDPTQYFKEDTEKGNPNFVANPTNDPTLDLVSNLPVLKGKEKEAVDTAGGEMDAYLSGPFRTGLMEFGVPPSTAEALARFAKPYQTTKDALKMLKVTSRQGAVRSGVRSKFMSDTIEASPEIKAIMMKKKKTQAEWEMATRVGYAALLAYDLQFPESEETKYAKEHNNPPYNYPDLKKLQEEYEKVKEKAESAPKPKKAPTPPPTPTPTPKESPQSSEDLSMFGFTPEEEAIYREIMGGQLGRSVLEKIQKIPLPVPKKRGRKKLAEKK